MSNLRPGFLLMTFALWVAACGGPGAAAPTAIPAAVSVPDQPAPVYVDDASRFRVDTPLPVFDVVATGNGQKGEAQAPVGRPTLTLPFQQTPSALGVIRAGAILRDGPGGLQIGLLAAGETVTITGKSRDGSSYAVFSQDGVAGWLAVDTVVVFGGDDLIAVDEALGPGPIATLIAEAMHPMEPSVLEGVGTE